MPASQVRLANSWRSTLSGAPRSPTWMTLVERHEPEERAERVRAGEDRAEHQVVRAGHLDPVFAGAHEHLGRAGVRESHRGDRDHVDETVVLQHGHGPRLDLGSRTTDVATDERVELHQLEMRVGCDPLEPAQPTAESSIQLGEPEAVCREHAVEAEGSAVVVRRLEMVTDPTGEVAHGRRVVGTRLPGRAETGVDEPAVPGLAQDDELHGGEDRDAVGKDDPVDAARHAVEEGRDSHPVAACGEVLSGVACMVDRPHPADVVGAAVEPVSVVADPHHLLDPGLVDHCESGLHQVVVRRRRDLARRLPASRRPRAGRRPAACPRGRPDGVVARRARHAPASARSDRSG